MKIIYTISEAEKELSILKECEIKIEDNNNVCKEKSSILSEVISSVVIPADNEKFIVKDRFSKEIFSYLGSNFKKWFIDKIEDKFSDSTIYFRNLKENSIDKNILNELNDKLETTLREVYFIIDNGELDKKKWYLFYIPDVNGILRAVGVHWDGRGWRAGADSVGDPRAWSAGFVIASRNS
jgi:hypothetical protein